MLKRLLALLLCFLLAASQGMCSDYIITDQQLTRLENNFITLEANNKKLQADLSELKQRSKTQEELLASANISFEQYAASQRNKLRRTKAERNALLVLLSGAAVALVINR